MLGLIGANLARRKARASLTAGGLGLGAFISPVLTWWTIARAVMIGIAIGVIGALYPIWMVTRMRSPVALART